jgi:glyoxylase-like metal-dependent hydrolase (beta-lactamase superfamily II)
VFLGQIVTRLWGENCYILSRQPTGPALVIDPGWGAAEACADLLARRSLSLAGVLCSHGHIDHVADAAELADRFQAPVFIQAADLDLLTQPGLGLDPALVRQLLGSDRLPTPGRVEVVDHGQVLELAGYAIEVVSAPGHTPGSVLYLLRDPAGPLRDLDGRPLPELAHLEKICFSGDVLFAGSIGRTDLPGGSMAQMRRSLRQVVLALDDDWGVWPGHGPATTMAIERADNPYLQRRFLEDSP